MPENQEQQQADEQRIVEAFLQVAKIPHLAGSIQSLGPPRPDVMCTLENGTGLAFELTEVIDPKQARNYNFGIEVETAITQLYERLEPTKHVQLTELFGNAILFIVFDDGTTQKKAIDLLPGLFKFLFTCTSEVSGDIDNTLLPNGIKRITVARSKAAGPEFNVSGLALLIRDTMLERITKKFSKEYKCDYPLELLVHSKLHTLQPEILWLKKVQSIVPNRIQNSPFQRVWVFDYVEQNIIYVYPEL